MWMGDEGTAIEAVLVSLKSMGAVTACREETRQKYTYK
jgi:hypothetical protein